MNDRPSPQKVAKRALALATFYYRATYEREWPTRNPQEREEDEADVADMKAYLQETGLVAALSDTEAILFGQPLGKWHAQDAKNLGWRGENLLVLLWALRKVESLPPIWEQSFGVHTFADEAGPTFIKDAALRPVEEIERMDHYLEAVRLRERTPDGFEGIPWLATQAESAGGEPPLDGDLPIDGKPYRSLDSQTKNTVASLALERHKATQWILGYEDDLDTPAPEV